MLRDAETRVRSRRELFQTDEAAIERRALLQARDREPHLDRGELRGRRVRDHDELDSLPVGIGDERLRALGPAAPDVLRLRSRGNEDRTRAEPELGVRKLSTGVPYQETGFEAERRRQESHGAFAHCVAKLGREDRIAGLVAHRVGAKAPQAVLVIAGGVLARSIVGVAGRLFDPGASRRGSSAMGVGIGDARVDTFTDGGPDVRRIDGSSGADPDGSCSRRELGMGDAAVGGFVNGADGEAESPLEKRNRGAGVGVAGDGVESWCHATTVNSTAAAGLGRM